MKYFELDFKITPFSTDAAAMLMTLVGEAGLESFVETEDGFKGYAQERLFHQETLDEMVEAFPFIDHQVTYTIVEAEDKNWNEQWEKEGFKPVVIADRVLVTNQQDAASSYDYKIIIDPSHATGDWKLVEAMSLAAVAAGCDGLMIEVHDQPECAWSDGSQSLKPEKFKALVEKVKKVAEVLGRSI